MGFGERLKEARRKKGITQKELAEKLDIPYQQIGQYETGKRNPRKDTLDKIATALNLGYSYTKEGEPYFYDFVDTVRRPEYEENEHFNEMQFDDAEGCVALNDNYNSMNHIGKKKLVEYSDDIVDKYRKDTE